MYAREQRAVFVLIHYDQHFVVLGKAPDAKMCTYCDTWSYNWKDGIKERRGIFHHCEDFEEIEAVLAIMHIEQHIIDKHGDEIAIIDENGHDIDGWVDDKGVYVFNPAFVHCTVFTNDLTPDELNGGVIDYKESLKLQTEQQQRVQQQKEQEQEQQLKEQQLNSRGSSS